MARFFCYGTLKRGYSAHSLLARSKPQFLGEAKTHQRYHLYDCGEFPGMKEDDSKVGGVHGELFDVTEQSLRMMDLYECVAEGLFRRINIDLEDGSTAIAYLIGEISEHDLHIQSGRWEHGQTEKSS